MRIEIFHTRVFAAGPGGGNPCPVIPFSEGLTDSQMLGLAGRFGLDTAFITKPKSAGAHIGVRYFVPKHEMGISGHATVAALSVGVQIGFAAGPKVVVETASGLFPAELQQHDGTLTIVLEQRTPSFGIVRKAKVVAPVLNLRVGDLDVEQSPIQSVSVSRPKLLIPLRNSSVLDGIVIDPNALERLCEDANVTGLYPFTRQTHRQHANAEARQFPYRAGFLEDAATGVAAAALAAYLVKYDRHCIDGQHEMFIAQGFVMGAPSLIGNIVVCTERRFTRIAIRGHATITGREQIKLENN